MENTANLVINGGIRLPVGYRFCPTDEELLHHYLKRKVFDLPLPASVIPHFDVFLTDPWALPGDLKERRFFFSKQKSFTKRSAGCGIWRSIGKEKLILSHGSSHLLGLRKSLVFSETTTQTRWVMHEYRLAASATTTTTPNSTHQSEVGDWAVYCVFQKRRRPKKQRVVEEKQRLGVAHASEDLDLTEFPHPCSSCSSGLTQVSSNGTEIMDQEESSSGYGYGYGYAFGLPSYSNSSVAHVGGV